MVMASKMQIYDHSGDFTRELMGIGCVGTMQYEVKQSHVMIKSIFPKTQEEICPNQ